MDMMPALSDMMGGSLAAHEYKDRFGVPLQPQTTQDESPRRGRTTGRGSVSLGRRYSNRDPVKGWRIAEIHLAFREFDRKKKGFLNSTELRRCLLNFGIAWNYVKAAVPVNHYWNFTDVMEKVEKLQPAEAIADKIWHMFQHADRQEQRDGKCNGKVKAKEFCKNLKDHGLTDEDVYILCYKYSNGQNNDKKAGRVNGQIGYGDLHRDLFPTDGWETAKYWQQFEELFYTHMAQETMDPYGDPGSPTSPASPRSPLEPISPRGWKSGGNWA
jgi:Ca2+-binding EF-hand superfamily protein